MPAIAQTFPLFFLNQDRYRQNVINGGFDIWQRGRTFTLEADESYTADRFVASSGATGQTMEVEQYSLPVDNPLRAYGIKNAMRITGLTIEPAPSNPRILTRIPGAEYGAGDSVSFGMWMWADAPLTLDRIGLNREYGSGGTPSAKEYYTFASAVTIGTTPTFYEFSLNLGSIVGKTFGTDGNDYLEIVLWFPKKTVFNCYTTGWQMNTGARCLPYQPKTESQELAACLPFYERIVMNNSPFPGAFRNFGTLTARGYLQYTPKWKKPNSIGVDDVDSFFLSQASNNWLTAFTYNTANSSQSHGIIDITCTNSVGTKGDVYLLETAGDGHYVEVDAEL